MKAATQAHLRRTQIREVMKRHKGSLLEVAGSLGVTPNMISMWLAGRTKSKPVEEACRAHALRLLDEEQRHAA